MRICCLGVVKNEADIIEAFVRHAARYADQICLLDNGSTDGTREILAGLVREGLPLLVLDDPVVGHFQGEKMTWLYRRIAPLYRPDFLLLLDADEFLTAPDRPALEAALARLPPRSCGALRWYSYVLRPEDAAQPMRDPPRQIRWRFRPEIENAMAKAVLRCDSLPPEQTVVLDGNHRIVAADPAVRLRRINLDEVALAHFPVRSLDQVAKKTLLGWIAFVDRSRAMGRWEFKGFWHATARKVLAGGEIDAAEALALNLRYAKVAAPERLEDILVEDPLPVGYELRLQSRALPAMGTVIQAFTNHIAGSDRFAMAMAAREGGVDGVESAPAPLVPGAAPPAGVAPADLGPLRRMLQRYAPRSLLELGCGAGAMLLDAQAAGIRRVVGLDAEQPAAGCLLPAALQPRDPTRPFELNELFDLVVALTPAQRLPGGRAEALVDNIVRHAGRAILFLLPWPTGRWLDAFAQRGWHPVLAETMAVRLSASMPVLRHGLVVLERREAPDEEATAWVRRAAAQPLAGAEPRGIVATPLHDFDPLALAAAPPADAVPAAAPPPAPPAPAPGGAADAPQA